MAERLLDDDGENLAVRTFLMHYGAPGMTVKRMRYEMRMAGWDGFWPEWANDQDGHLTKFGTQQWLRHLFGLENANGVGEAQGRGDCNPLTAKPSLLSAGPAAGNPCEPQCTAGVRASDDGRAVMQQALDALELHGKQYPHMVKGYCLDAIAALREHLSSGVPVPSQSTLDSPSIAMPLGLTTEEKRQHILSHASGARRERNPAMDTLLKKVNGSARYTFGVKEGVNG